MTSWDNLAREVDAWAATGRPLEFWWRDDDAITDTAALSRLIESARGVPLALAVIPAGLTDRLPAALRGHSAISVLQHGFDHGNRAPSGAKKSEFPTDRPWAEAAADLVRGRDLLAEAFGPRFVPALTPPWNRIGANHLANLPGLGYRGISTYLPRPAASHVHQVNTHVDVVNWHGRRGFLGTEAVLDLFTRHLADKRLGQADRNEPTGLLTHHLVHDTETWEFLGAFLDWCANKPNIQWRSAANLFPELGVK